VFTLDLGAISREMSFVVHGNNLKNKTKWERKSLKTFILACWTFFIIIVEGHEEADEEVPKKG
jgi:hypothetical protein